MYHELSRSTGLRSRSQLDITYQHKQDAQLSQRDRAARCVIDFAKSRRLHGKNILRTLYVYLQPLWYDWPQNLSISVEKRKIRAITAFKSPYATSYRWLIVTGIPVPFRSYRSLLFKFWTPCVFEPPIGGLGTTYDVHLGLIRKRIVDLNWTFLLGVTAQSLWTKRNRKSAISLQRGHFDPKFQVLGVAPHFCTVS